MHKFSQNVKPDVGLFQVAATATATTYTGTGSDMQMYNNFCGYVMGGIGAGTQDIGTLTMYIAESTDNITFSATYLATATCASATATAKGYGGTIECRAEQMTDGYRYLRVEVLPVKGTTSILAIANLRFNSRYPAATLPTP